MSLEMGVDGEADSQTMSVHEVVRFEDVYAAVSEVIDPCSDAMGRPLSLVEMNLVRRLEISGKAIVVGITLTEPTCLYTFTIAEQVTATIQARCGEDLDVRVELDSDLPNGVWTEAQLSGVAAARLRALRDADRASLGEAALLPVTAMATGSRTGLPGREEPARPSTDDNQRPRVRN